MARADGRDPRGMRRPFLLILCDLTLFVAYMITYLAAIISWSTSRAHSQPASCLDTTQSWTWPYANDPILAVTYYVDVRVLAVSYTDGVIHLASNVPQSVANKFQGIAFGQSPDAYWNSIRGSYSEILQAQSHCPLLAQNGAYLLSAPSRND